MKKNNEKTMKASERKAIKMKDRIISALGRAESLDEASRMLKMTNTTLRKYCGHLGLAMKTYSQRQQEKVRIDEAKAKELYEANVPMDEIKRQLGVSKGTLDRWAKENGLSRRNPSMTRLINSMSSRTQEIIHMRFSGVKLQDIGDKFGITRERVRQIINAYADKQFLDRDFADRCIQIRSRGISWEEIMEIMGVTVSKQEFLGGIKHLFSEEEQNKYIHESGI